MIAFVYILRCADGSYYVGSTRKSLESRVAEHNTGHYGGYTKARRPVELVFQQPFERIDDAIAAERQIKGWSRAKKEALMQGDWSRLKRLAASSPFDKLRVRTTDGGRRVEGQG
jgi:predicted GIY-YIG superfamily endonuclease